ncbi:MAG: LysR family transcriptional regulator [Candidatus Bathyarchaeota archaeon]|nr:LysR family transcriptional regulator [Candidatus Termiticorpusculum sp.]
MNALSYRTKLWMVNGEGESVFGDGIAELIENIDKYHSILEAAKNLNMSYRYALHRITLAEKRLGESLIMRVRGGAKGGGSSEVTPYGRSLAEQYRRAQVELKEFLEKMP